MSRFATAQARFASALIITGAILSSAASADAVGVADDASALARTLLSKSAVGGSRNAALPTNEGAAPVDSHESARRLLGGHSAATNQRAATAQTSDRSAATTAADDGRTADASYAARRMIAGNGG